MRNRTNTVMWCITFFVFIANTVYLLCTIDYSDMRIYGVLLSIIVCVCSGWAAIVSIKGKNRERNT